MNEGQKINISFLHFDIGCTGPTDTVFGCGLFRANRNSCANDWLQIEDKIFCGEIPTPFSIITNKNSVNVRLKTSTVDTRTGFLAIWSASDDPTTKRFKGTKGGKGKKGSQGNLDGRRNKVTKGKKGSRENLDRRRKKGAEGKKGAKRG